jgi:hypothetical protein
MEFSRCSNKETNNRVSEQIPGLVYPIGMIRFLGSRLFPPRQLQYPLCRQFAHSHTLIAVHPEMYTKWDTGVGVFVPERFE